VAVGVVFLAEEVDVGVAVLVGVTVLTADLVDGVVLKHSFSVQMMVSCDWQEQVLQPSAATKESPT
jgi:hypothetical protein